MREVSDTVFVTTDDGSYADKDWSRTSCGN